MSPRYARVAGAALLTVLAALPARASAQVGVRLQLIYPVETLYVADFTTQSVNRNAEFLSVTLMEGTGRDQNVVLEMSVTMERPTRSLMARAHTREFLLQGPVRRLTNRDLTLPTSDVRFVDYEITNNNVVLRTGMLPAGTYVFRAVVRTPGGVELGSDELRIEIGNPTRVDLLSPGRPVGEPPLLVTTPSPRFIWSTEGTVSGAGAAAYVLRVVRADGASSPEEAMQGFAAWETVTSETSAFYPGSASALPLEAGATYAWQVVRDVRSSAGVQRLESPIYWFRMAANGSRLGLGGLGGEEGVRQRLEALSTALGLAELQGFTTVTNVTVDGRTVGLDGVEQLLAAIAAGEIAVKSIKIR